MFGVHPQLSAFCAQTNQNLLLSSEEVARELIVTRKRLEVAQVDIEQCAQMNIVRIYEPSAA